MGDRFGDPRLGGRGDSPAARERLDRFIWSISVQPRPEMPDLDGCDAISAIDLSIHDQPAADAAADGDVEHDAPPTARAEAGFRQRGRVAIVSHDSRHAERPLAPVSEWKIVPAFDLMA